MEKRLPLEGVKVADFSWVGVGPVTARYLAEMGALVVHAESRTHPDTLRTATPYKDNVPGIDRSGYFANFNADKYGLSLNFTIPKGAEIGRRLALWADVVVESFAPGVMERAGLGYRALSTLKPELIYASTCQMGQTGPYRHYRGFGAQGAALAGFVHLAGFPGQPYGPYAAYTDFVSHRYLIIAILSALEVHRRTGRGQYIDLAQVEAGAQFLAPALLQYTINGQVQEPTGNGDPLACPHGAFRCQGDDNWCVIAVQDEAEWRALCAALGHREWLEDQRFATLRARKEHEEALGRLLEAWTRERTAEEVMHHLQQADVSAGMVAKAQDLFNDPQLQHRQHFVWLDHPVIGKHSYDAPAFRASKTPYRVERPAPCIGQHNEYVLKELLGMEDGEIAQATVDGALE